MLLERSRLGVAFRMIGEDATLAELNGIAVARLKVLAAGLAGALAGIGGGLYAHLTTYVEPRIFDVMLGVHSLAYGLIGGLGTALGPLLGVLIDIGLLEFDPRVRRLSHDHLRRPGRRAADRAAARVARREARAPHPPRLVALVCPFAACHKSREQGADMTRDRIGLRWWPQASSACRRDRRSLKSAPRLTSPAARQATTLRIRLHHHADQCAHQRAAERRDADGRRRHAVDADDAQCAAGEGGAGQEPGTYQARLALEMHGDWALQLNLSGPLRDRVVANIRFDPDQATPTVPSRARPGHKH